VIQNSKIEEKMKKYELMTTGENFSWLGTINTLGRVKVIIFKHLILKG